MLKHNLQRSTFGQALAGAAVYWAALPPLDLVWLAWIAPVWWLMLIRRKELLPTAAPGRWSGWVRAWPWPVFWAVVIALAGVSLVSPPKWMSLHRGWPMLPALALVALRFSWPGYRGLWYAGLLFWMAAIHWLRLPFWGTSFGWWALSAYLACYLPLFVGLSRVAVHRLKVPLVVAAPIVWMGLELARAHGLSGFTMGALGHTQYRWLRLIQVSDLAGVFAVDFVMMFVAACLARMLPCEGRRWTLWPAVPMAAMLAAVLIYGQWRLAAGDPDAPPQARIALIQGSIDVEFGATPEVFRETYEQYRDLSYEAVRRFGQVDLIVWPESGFPIPLVTLDEGAPVPDGWDEWEDLGPKWQPWPGRTEAHVPQVMGQLAQKLGAPLLVGAPVEHLGPNGSKEYNAAVMVARSGKIVDRYDKMHLVLFGEYLPFADWFPWMYNFSPLCSSCRRGERPRSYSAGSLKIAPDICYETVLSHVIRGQVNALAADGQEPDVLVNLTNDGWFWGSSQLDMHLRCAVFRAIECRKPILIAANTGFSAVIDGDGRIRQQGLRRATDFLLAEVAPDPRGSWYLGYGDWPAGCCLGLCVLLGLVGAVGRLRTAVGRLHPAVGRLHPVPSPSGRGLG